MKKKNDYSNDFVHSMNVRGVQNRPVKIMNCLLIDDDYVANCHRSKLLIANNCVLFTTVQG